MSHAGSIIFSNILFTPIVSLLYAICVEVLKVFGSDVTTFICHAGTTSLMEQTTIYLTKAQKKRIGELPRHVSFSAMVRINFDVIMKSCEGKSFVREIR